MTLLGRELGWTDDRLAEVQDADYLHDIGKIAVSDRVLLKAGPLSSEEWELMRQHPGISAEIVRPLFSEELTLAVRHHHERFDGDGYPDGLAGAAIPLVARAMCLVDAYDAMSCGRPYKVGLTRRQCLDEMRRCSGAQFDPELVTTFVRALERLEGRRRRGVAVAERPRRSSIPTGMPCCGHAPTRPGRSTPRWSAPCASSATPAPRCTPSPRSPFRATRASRCSTRGRRRRTSPTSGIRGFRTTSSPRCCPETAWTPTS